ATYLHDDPEEAARWRVEGAAYLARAAELGSTDGLTAWRALGGAGSLLRAGERAAAIRFYRRAPPTTEDAELRSNIELLQSRLEGESAVAARQARRQRLEREWRKAFPGWSLTSVLAAGPPFDPAACAGGNEAPDRDTSVCALTWAEWTERVDR